ncbi:PREDICTED: fatty acid amide hydrolase-like [Amphimedon queenslandica]|uniref:Amidase domain-containing protein n=1 Tax=Amphimedon queenslandica TaxID=400682 RepID=A0A1X7T166_AMPQE|nr:PREDICTED: fatty acid amide hydrolase-like [Amphimedon queenslandica]|eukprot:XP_019861856.1 PREDICTED: fatty acid amide hydrolase-like [Amphimedon queenslandica]
MLFFAVAFLSFLFIFISLLFFLTYRRPVCTGKRAGEARAPVEQLLDPSNNPSMIKYEVKDLSSPKLVGYLFRILSLKLLSLLGSFVIRNVKKKSNLDLMNGEYIPEPPTLFPPVPPPLRNEAIEQSNAKLLEDIAGSYASTNGRISSLDYWVAYKSGNVEPVDVARAVLESVRVSNSRSPPLRAIVETDDELTMKLAQESTRRWREGKPLSLLDGIPFAVKAQIKFESYSLTGGATFEPTCSLGLKEAKVVRRLVEAGAIMVGLANMQEFGTGVFGSNPHKEYMTARNPYNDECYCGGSSSGSAAAVASGLCPITIGGDAGGSIRTPSSFCGITGLKTTFGSLDLTGFLPQTPSVGVIGPMCSTSVDAAIAMNVMEPGRFDLSGLADIKDLSGLRIGVYNEYFDDADPQVVSLCREALDALASLGAEVKDIVIPELEELRVAHLTTVATEFFTNYAVDIDKRVEEMNSETIMLFSVGKSVSAKEYINAQKQRTRSISIIKSLFEEVDLIATPATGSVAPAIPPGAEKYGYGNMELTGKIIKYASLANFTGIPGISIPVGLTSGEGGGLPVGFLLQSHWNNEGLLLRVGSALEELIPMEKPPIYYNIIEEAMQIE